MMRIVSNHLIYFCLCYALLRTGQQSFHSPAKAYCYWKKVIANHALFLGKFKWEDFMLFGISSKAREQSDQVLCLKERFEFVRPLS